VEIVPGEAGSHKGASPSASVDTVPVTIGVNSPGSEKDNLRQRLVKQNSISNS
jgi:hypothetical protein